MNAKPNTLWKPFCSSEHFQTIWLIVKKKKSNCLQEDTSTSKPKCRNLWTGWERPLQAASKKQDSTHVKTACNFSMRLNSKIILTLIIYQADLWHYTTASLRKCKWNPFYAKWPQLLGFKNCNTVTWRKEIYWLSTERDLAVTRLLRSLLSLPMGLLCVCN